MGRIKTQLIKRTARKLFNKYPGEAKINFDENKAVVTNLLVNPNKKMRNIVAGYLSRLAKQQVESAKPKVKRVMSASRGHRSPRYDKSTSRQR